MRLWNSLRTGRRPGPADCAAVNVGSGNSGSVGGVRGGAVEGSVGGERAGTGAGAAVGRGA